MAKSCMRHVDDGMLLPKKSRRVNYQLNQAKMLSKYWAIGVEVWSNEAIEECRDLSATAFEC